MITKELQPDIETALRILKDAGAKKVFLFGSAVTGRLNSSSDLDIGVTGLPPESFFTVYARLSEMLSRPVDLVDFDKQADFLCMLKNIKEVEEIE